MSDETRTVNDAEVMNQGAMVEVLMDRLGADFPSRAAATRIVKGVFSLMAESLAAGKPVRMQGFGSFETYKAAPRMGRNPQTNEPLEIPGATRVRFSAANALKDAVNQR